MYNLVIRRISMNWTLFLVLSIAVLAASSVGGTFCFFKKYKSGSILTTTNILFIGVIISALLLYIPIYIHEFSNAKAGILQSVLVAFQSMIRLFVVEGSYSDVLDAIGKVGGMSDVVYYGYSHILNLLITVAPLLTFGFILSFFKNFLAYLRFIWKNNSQVFVFSELSDKSLALARSVQEKYGRKVGLVFTDVFDKNEEKSYDLIEEARELGAVCFKKDIVTLDFSFHRKTQYTVTRTPKLDKDGNPVLNKKEEPEYIVTTELFGKEKNVNMFLIGEDQSENLEQALKIIGNKKYNRNINLYVFSTQIESEFLLAHAFNNAAKEDSEESKLIKFLKKIGSSISTFCWKAKCLIYKKEFYRYDENSHIRVRRVNEVNSLIARTLYEKGKEAIFDSALPADEKGIRKINALIVGMGQHGTEMTKALSWMCQMDGYQLELHATDISVYAKERFISLCPELMDSEHNGKFDDPGESKYYIEIHPGINVDTKEFDNMVKYLPQITYVLVALGNDEKNIAVAIHLRSLFARLGWKPVIQAIVYNSNKKEALVGITNYRNQGYEIDFIGDLKTSFSEKSIMRLDVEAQALARHLRWGVESDFWKYDYNYKSSIASAIHYKMKCECEIPGIKKPAAKRTPEELLGIRMLEHCRWNAYMRSEGYVYSGSLDPNSRNDLAKMHHCLVTYDLLSEKDKAKDDD